MTATKKRQLTQEEALECEKLNDIFQAKKSEFGLTQEKMAFKMGITQPAVGHYLNGRNPLNIQSALKFSEILQVPVKDFSPRLSNELKSLGLIFSKDDDAGIWPSGLAETSGNYRSGSLPLLQWKDITSVGDAQKARNRDKHPSLLSPFAHSQQAFALKYCGDSMSPEYREGEYVLVEPSFSFKHNNDVLAQIAPGRFGIRRIQITSEGTYLLAVNSSHPNRKIEIIDSSAVIGPITGSWQPRHSSTLIP